MPRGGVNCPPEASPYAQQPPEVLDGRFPDPDVAVRIVHPAHRQLEHPIAQCLRQDQQFGIEKPRIVLDQRQQRGGGRSCDGLEPALGVGELCAKTELDQAIITT